MTRKELDGLGLGGDRLYRQIRAGEWLPSGRRILVHNSAPKGLLTDSLVTAIWQPEMLTGPSAAVMSPHPAWDSQSFADQQPMVVADRGGRGPWRSVRHRGATTAPHPLGLKVADHHTTLVDLLRFLPRGDALTIGTNAIRSGLTTPAALEEAVVRLGKTDGVQQLRDIAAAIARGAESAPEAELHRALHRAGIRGWKANPEVLLKGKLYRPDIAFMPERVAMEYDGFGIHSRGSAFHPDRHRQNMFVFHDWLVVRVTNEMLTIATDREELMDGTRGLVLQRRAEIGRRCTHRRCAR